MLEKIKSPADLKKLHTDELEILAEEVRREIISTTLHNGGHLASNLGAVELTLALHYVFDAPEDKFIFDVGHQCYTHKLITGRYDKFSSLRKKDGLSGFPNHCESEYDTFDSGHSSTAISLALGLARARDINKKDNNIIAIVGDGAIGGGMAFEALNDVGTSVNTKLIIILNDNEMSISKNVGALSSHFSRLRAAKKYMHGKRKVKKALDSISRSGKLVNFVSHLRDTVRYFLIGETIFDAMNIKYLGPVDGHSFSGMIDIFRRAKECQTSVIIHVVTRKGHGYEKAENDPESYHGISPKKNTNIDEIGYSETLGATLCSLAEKLPVCAVTAGMTYNTGLREFSQKHPDRFFDTGIAEQHALAMAGGLAKGGMRPFVVIYSTFLQRGFDQLFHDICLQKLPVAVCIDHAGLTGEDGATHQGIYDIGFLRSMPGLTLLAPRDTDEFARMLEYSASSDMPVAIRYPKGCCGAVDGTPFVSPSWDVLAEGINGSIITFGRCISFTMPIARELGVSLIDARSLKPLDGNILKKIKDKPIFVIEDNASAGGLCEAVLDYYSRENATVTVRGFSLNDEFVAVGTVSEQLVDNGITPDAIAQKIKDAIG